MTSPGESAYQYLEQALQREAARQSSLEQRTVGVLSAYTAAIATAIALAAIVTPDTPVSEGAPLVLLIAGGIMTVSGLTACIVGLAPRRLNDPPDENLSDLPNLVKDEKDPDAALSDLNRALADELVGLRPGTAAKAICLLIGSACFAGSITMLGAALMVAL